MEKEGTIIGSSEDETHLQTTLKLNKVLEDKNNALLNEIQRLKTKITSLQHVQVLVFGSSKQLGVAMVASSDNEGVHELANTIMAFEVKSKELEQKGVGYEIIRSVKVNEFHADPFKSELG
jgi:hypothetical protein